MSTFLTLDELATLTGRRLKSKQVEQLRTMGIAFWVNAIGRPVVTTAAVEGRKEAPQQKTWIQPRVSHGSKANRYTDAMYAAVYAQGSAPLRDAMDLAYLTGQRPADTLRMTEHDIIEGHLIVTQAKTQQPLRIIIAGKLADLVERIRARKATHRIVTGALLTNTNGKRLTAPVLRNTSMRRAKLQQRRHRP